MRAYTAPVTVAGWGGVLGSATPMPRRQHGQQQPRGGGGGGPRCKRLSREGAGGGEGPWRPVGGGERVPGGESLALSLPPGAALSPPGPEVTPPRSPHTGKWGRGPPHTRPQHRPRVSACLQGGSAPPRPHARPASRPIPPPPPVYKDGYGCVNTASLPKRMRRHQPFPHPTAPGSGRRRGPHACSKGSRKRRDGAAHAPRKGRGAHAYFR